jgi:hypothetical protein
MKINVYRTRGSNVSFETLSLKRDWMEITSDKHAYKCFPIALANTLGWTFSYPEDISFILKRNPEKTIEDVEILSGHRYVSTNRLNATISFVSDLTFDSDENVTLLLMPVPNQFIDGVQGFTNLISTSVLKSYLPYAWKITKANEIITIPAGTPIVSIVPISLSRIQDVSMNIFVENFDKSRHDDLRNYGIEASRQKDLGKYSNFYRDAKDHKGNQVGSHELKSLKLSINNYLGNNNEQ